MKRKAALVLSSGGARGIAHIGVIEELLQSGYEITSVAGTSMGSVIGGMYALGKLEEYKEWLLKVTRMDIIKFLDLTVGKGGLVKGEKLVQVLAGFIGDACIENLPIPYTAVAVDILHHSEMVFDSGSLMKAIRASISIPTIFLPVSSDHTLLVDGGVLNPLPLGLVKRFPGDLLIAVNVNSSVPYVKVEAGAQSSSHEAGYSKARAALNKRWSKLVSHGNKEISPKPKEMGMFDLVAESINLMQNKLSTASIEQYHPDIVINIPYAIATAYDFYKAEELVEAGREASREAISVFDREKTLGQ